MTAQDNPADFFASPASASDRRAVAGWLANKSGGELEDDINKQALYIPGLLLVKQHPHVKFIGKGQARVVGEAWPDYFGVYKGLPLMFDAKSTLDKAGFSPDGKREHQFSKLRLASEFGFLAFYLVYWRTLQFAEIHRIWGDMTWPVRLKAGQGDLQAYEPQWLESLCKQIDARFRVTIHETFTPKA